MSYDIVISMLAATLRLTTPLLLGCLAGLYSERSGIFDIGLEGKMLVGAFAAAAVSYLTANMWLGLLAANVSLFICKMESPDAPCVNADFFKACGLERGEQLDRPNCRILWADDKADLIVPAVEDMLATLPLLTEALKDCA